MPKFVLFTLALGAFAAWSVSRGSAETEPIDAAIRCTPSAQVLTYQCEVRVTQADTGFPLCLHGGTIELVRPSMLETVEKIELQPDDSGETKKVDLKLPMLGEWRIHVRVGTSIVAKRLNFHGNAVTSQ